MRRFLWLLALFALGLGLGLAGPWIGWLDREAGQRFGDRQWTQASRVYARPLELYPGLAMSAQRLERELEAIGLSAGDPASVGRYRRQGDGLEAHVPGFVFGDGRQAAQRVRVRFSGSAIAGLETATETETALVRLPPAELGSLLPLDDRDRTLVALAEFPPLLVTGIQAVEDRQFAHHHGVDPRGLLRAAWTNLRRGEVVQGGSTITQQLVKNLFLTPERSLLRKLNEAVMAISLERRFSKADILEAYLNEVYLGQDGGRAIHGFGRAAEHYFGLPVQALGVEQIALLVGMVRGASWYHPRRNPERARERRDRVIDMFYETGLIDEGAWRRARASGLGLGLPSRNGARRHDGFLDLVARQLRRDYRDSDLRGTGLRIFTTLDPVAQQEAERALAEGLTELERSSAELQGAVVLVEPTSGEIRALVGDRAPGRFGFNRALDARRPVGSVIKPFIYLLALAQPDRWHLASTLVDAPLSVAVAGQAPWRPDNIDQVSHGEVALMDALARSFNQATVALGREVGLPALFGLLEQLGVARPEQAHPSAFLGAIELTPLQVAQLYQPLAAEGYSTPLRAINQVLDREGNEIGRYDRRLRPVREREALALLDFALRHAVTDGTGRSLSWRLPEDPGVRGKTGTSNDRRDAWFVGYTDDWLGVVWTGRDDNAPAGVSGSATALPVWAELFSRLPLRTVRRNWPEGLEWFWIDWPSPQLAAENCPDARAIPFVAGSQPTARSPCLDPLPDESRRWFRRR
ncbi:penicillin-binding protein 1B [Wenzhouxiangella limi]|uniref:Penicillin-binding protein 1B n=1 Tax=Wenzhouxiangella limi TaxID=2707351 RepID=A0A845V4I4_9GAMM|nr:penicillin-binding protein 1B [Wenzhouxiangella limi]NDY96096.1 penicillin-binding protein 1B [Wenzhouxiangella limi]